MVKNPVLWKKKVKTIGIAIAISIILSNGSIYFAWIERIPGKPPIPIALAVILKVTESKPAIDEPIIPATNG